MSSQRYVVGFVGANQCVYGKHTKDDEIVYGANPLTRQEAERHLKRLWGGEKAAIYKLVPIKVTKTPYAHAAR